MSTDTKANRLPLVDFDEYRTPAGMRRRIANEAISVHTDSGTRGIYCCAWAMLQVADAITELRETLEADRL